MREGARESHWLESKGRVFACKRDITEKDKKGWGRGGRFENRLSFRLAFNGGNYIFVPSKTVFFSDNGFPFYEKRFAQHVARAKKLKTIYQNESCTF
jgi:hypothetical protein